MTDRSFKIAFKAEGVVVAESDVPDITPERVEQAARESLQAMLEDELEIDSDWVKSHHFEISVQVSEV